jgi:hypothetical protein
VLTKYERLGSQLRRVKEELRTGARIGTQVLANSGGGVVGGYIESKMPTVPNTTLKTNAVVGSALAFGAVVGLFSEYSDHVGAVGGGILAYALGKESEAYFNTP